MTRKQHRLTLYGLVFFLFILDRWLKYLAPTSDTHFVIPDIFAWEYFENTGIAFGIPVPLSIIIIGTPILLVLLLHLVGKNTRSRLPWYLLLFLGALSNLFDRVLFGHVIDYFRIFDGVINIADIMIIIGLGRLFIYKT